MNWAKIYFPTTQDETRGFYELARRTRVISYKEGGRGMFQVPVASLTILRGLGIRFEIAAQSDHPRPEHLSLD